MVLRESWDEDNSNLALTKLQSLYQEETISIMSSLPEEIYFEIFLKVPAVKSLLACKFVCKTWYSLISRPDFITTQLNLTIPRKNPNLMLRGFDNRKPPGKRNVIYSIAHDLSLSPWKEFLDHAAEIDDYPFKSCLGYSVKLMAGCDGLVCLWFGNRNRFCLWNPATREYKVLPKSHIEYVDMVAFGYDYKSDDYKLLAGYGSLFEVCSLGSNSWKNIENVQYEFNKQSYGRFVNRELPSGVRVNGNLHWLAETQHSCDVVLVSLDISSEIFKEVELPFKPFESEDDYRDFRNLGVLEGRLCLFVVDICHGSVEVWTMENYDVPKSWTKRHMVNNKTAINVNARLMWSFKSGEILFGGTATGPYLYFPGDDKYIELNISSLAKLYEGVSYFESLVSLKSGTYAVGEEQMEESDTPAYIQ